MGFGYLLIGYFVAFAFSLANVYFFFDIIGGAIMLVGLAKLASHGKNFYRAMLLDIAYIFLCLLRTALPFLGIVDGESGIFYALGIVIALVSLAFRFFILAAIYFIAEKVDLADEMSKARRNIKCIFLYYIPYVICMTAAVIGLDLGLIGNIVFLADALFGLVVLFLDLVLIHSCYCRICMAGQESGERTPSRFKWLNTFYEKTDKMFDGAYLRVKKEKTEKQEPDTEEPAFRRIKRKKKSKRK